MKNISGITQLEAMTVIVALKLWKLSLQGLRFTIHCDNEVTVYVVNSGHARDTFLQKCVREIAFLACKHEFKVKAVHIEFSEATDASCIKEDIDIDMLMFSFSW